MNPNPEAPMQQKGWFSRNWKWLLPVGCLVPLMCCGGFGAVTYFGVTTMIQSSVPFKEAMEKVNQSPEVAKLIGTPASPTIGVSGNFNETNGSGTADFTVPLKGKKGAGTLHVVAHATGGKWEFSKIDVSAHAKTIDVLEGDRKANEPPPEDAPDDDGDQAPEGARRAR
jgi:hypothetical protein